MGKNQPVNSGAMVSDRRKTVRLDVQSVEDSWLNESLEYEVMDLSADGVGLRSNHPLKKKERIKLTLEDGSSAEIEVVVCNMTTPPDEYTDGEFRVGCKFVPKKAGHDLMAILARLNSHK